MLFLYYKTLKSYNIYSIDFYFTWTKNSEINMIFFVLDYA